MARAQRTEAGRWVFTVLFLAIGFASVPILDGGAARAEEGGQLESEATEKADLEAEADPTVPKGWYPSLTMGFDLQFGVSRSFFSSDTVPTLGVTDEFPVNYAPKELYPYCGAATAENECPAGVRSFQSPSADASITSAMFTLQGDLVGPILSEELWDLRPFVALRGQVPTRINYTIYSYNGSFEPVNASYIGFANNRPNQSIKRAVFAASSVVHTTVGQVGNWFVGLGLDFTLPFLDDRRVALRPSLHYFGARLKYTADFFTKEYPDPSNPFGEFAKEDNGVPVMTLTGNNYITMHGVAPRIALDVLVTRQGPLAFSLYTEYQAMIILTGRDLDIEVPNEVGSGTARLEFSTDEVLHQMGFGVRISWIGWGAAGS